MVGINSNWSFNTFQAFQFALLLAVVRAQYILTFDVGFPRLASTVMGLLKYISQTKLNEKKMD